MKTGFSGAFVISWTQTELDGLIGADLALLTVGATWRWSGQSVRVNGPRDLLVLEDAIGRDELHRHAANNVRKIIGAKARPQRLYDDEDLRDSLFDGTFDVTDGHVRYTVNLFDMPDRDAPLVMFLGDVPPPDRDLWVVQCAAHVQNLEPSDEQRGGVICFTRGTMIRTEDGECPVEDLQEGDGIQTKDNGIQKVLWTGSRHISGARLFAMPHLRPIRIRANALGKGEPQKELIVSPEHRVLVRGKPAELLFNTSEVLVATQDLINDNSITVDCSMSEVSYIHIMLEQHQIIWAHGVETESFHPANADLHHLDGHQHQRLLDHFPLIERDPFNYGDFARRNLTRPEAAIMMHELAHRH